MSVIKYTALALALAACQSSTADRADRAAKKLLDKEAQFEGRERGRFEHAVDRTQNVFHEAMDVSRAGADFLTKKSTRIDVLRMQHGIVSLQPLAVSSLANTLSLTEAGRADVDEKLALFEMRIDESGNLIQVLRMVDAPDWQAKDDEVSAAMKRLTEARDAAFKALQDAPRLDTSS